MTFVSQQKRTHMCGDIRKSQVDQPVVLMGWVNSRRDHGGLVFVDLRDRTGLVQIVLDPGQPATAKAKSLRHEFVIAVAGKVRHRPAGMVNEKLATGAIEVEVNECEILSAAETPPFVIDDPKVTETVRLKYRYLALRSPKLQKNFFVRHQTCRVVRDFLADEGFLEIETAMLYKSTPEGARDYLVPSRVHPGNFYALPQSPQTMKQLLMVGGFDKYFQIARCFRDEDLRAERQPEFTQIDIEMSFVDEDDVKEINARLAKKIWREVKGLELGDIQRLSYREAMDRFGSDKPDLRNPLEISDCGDLVQNTDFKVFDNCLRSGGVVRGIGLPVAENISRSQIDKWMKVAKDEGAAGLIWIKKEGDEFQSPVNKFLSQQVLGSLYHRLCKRGGVALLISDTLTTTCRSLGVLRNQLAEQFDLIDTSKDIFCWITDFPLLEYDDQGKRWVACHHPFTQPKDEDVELLKSGKFEDLGKVRAKAYDLVCNGYELAGGSIRIHDQQVQKAMFKALGFSEAEAKEKFGFFVEALTYGTPPHGGIAWGLDRLTMILCGTDSIRDVIAFPKTAKAQCLMSESPSLVDRHQLLELGLKINSPERTPD